MEWRGIRQTSDILGAKRNPEAAEHGKTIVWNNTLGFFEYKSYWGGDFNTKTTHGIVYKGDDSAGANYVWKLDSNKNPFWRKEDFLVSAARSGNAALFTMNTSAAKTLSLGALAWLDTVGADITLPGDQKILFDDNNAIGGDAALKYNKTTKTIDLTGFVGIQVKNGVDPSLKGAFQYLGRKNVLVGHGTTRSVAWAASMEGNILSGEGAGGSLGTGSWNVMSGSYAGGNVSSNVSGSVFLGAYAGRLESASNKFHVGNTSYASEALGRLGSLLYGDFSTGWLRVNNRLEVGQEIRIGTFNIANTPLSGMVQFVSTDMYGSLVKPQYHDGFSWIDFATGANNYLSAVTKATADVGTISDAYKVTFVRNGLSNLTLQLGANAFNSTIIPQAYSAPTDMYGEVGTTAGLIQFSSGNNADSNRGFTSLTGLNWDNANTEFNIPGAIKLATKARYLGSGNAIVYDSGHYYGRIGANWIQLDNSPTSGQSNQLRFDGSVTAFDISLEKEGSDLPIKGLKPADIRIVMQDNLVDNDIDFLLDLSVTGINEDVISTTASYANVYRLTNNSESIAPTLRFRPLISTDGSVQFVTTVNNEINVSATGAGNPNLYTLGNDAGAGAGLFDAINSTATAFKIKTINAGTHIGIAANVNGLQVDLDVDDIIFTDTGAGIPLIDQDAVNSFSFTQKTFVNGIATTATASVTEIHFDVNKEIPKFSFTPSPVFIPGNPGQADWLLFKSDYSADIRTSDVLASTTMFTLGIGAGLYYNASQNTLSALNSVGSTTDYSLTSISKVGDTATFHVTDSFGGGVERTIDLDLGAQIAAIKATYTDNIAPAFGGVMINKSVKTTPLNSLQSLTLNEATGELGFSVEPVLLTPQYDLYDSANIAGDNLKRAIGRTNIGAAYVNGSATENFNADVSTSNQVVVDIYSATEFASDVSKIQGVKFKGPHVTSDELNTGVYLSKRTLSTDMVSSVEVRAGVISITTNGNNGSGNVEFWTSKSGAQVRIAYLDDNGNLHLKGEFITFDTTV